MQAEIDDYRHSYDVESPEALVADTSRELLEASDAAIDRSVVTTWQTTRRNLVFTQAALAIAHATTSLESKEPSWG